MSAEAYFSGLSFTVTITDTTTGHCYTTISGTTEAIGFSGTSVQQITMVRNTGAVKA